MSILLSVSLVLSLKLLYSDLFSAFENEYTIFCPTSNCFEIFGLDFMVDTDWGTHLLEVNPGPDFKQTGDRLQGVIMALFEQTADIVINEACATEDFTEVYCKEWSLSSQPSGMKLQ